MKNLIQFASRLPRQKDTRRRSKLSGFTLIETMIGGAILATSIIGTLTMASHSFILMQNVREFSRGNQVLQQKMEDIRLLSFTAIQALPDTFTDPHDTSGRYAGTITKETYRTDGDGAPAALKVTLKVTWTSRGGKTRTQSQVSVFTKNGLNDYVF